jgi:3-oxoisoapionate decarboxylase
MMVETTIHSFSLWHHFAHKPGFDAIAFAELARSMGFQGISLSLNNENYRHLGGRETARMDRLRAYLTTHGMSLEVDTSGTAPAHMSEMLEVAHRMGATSLRTYTRHGGEVREMMQNTADDLAAVTRQANDLGVIIVLENHEDFTGPELAEIVEQVNHPNLKVLYDYGNSQMVLEDPIAALDAVLPHVYSAHFKDHVMIRAEDAGQLTVAGVPVGDGFLPLTDLTSRLLDQGLRRFTFENVWAYSAPIRSGRMALNGVNLGEGAFAYLDPPFDPARVILQQSELTLQTLVDLESQALNHGRDNFRQVLKNQGRLETGISDESVDTKGQRDRQTSRLE